MQQAMYLGIDVSKGYADFSSMNSTKQFQEKGFQLDDNYEGHQRLVQYLTQRAQTENKIICGLESTGGYEKNWITLLKGLTNKLPVEVYKLNPKGVKHQIQSELTRTITDSVSARGIASYLANNYEKKKNDWQMSTLQEDREKTSRHFFRFIKASIKQQTARYNQLEKLIYQNFPELLVYCKQGIPNWTIRLLIKYPGVSSINRSRLTGIDGIKGISRAKAEKIKEIASTSAAYSSDPTEELMIKTLAEDIQHHQKRIEDLKERLVQLYSNPNINIIKSIRGIGDWTAAALLIYLDPVSRFETTDQIAAFYGVNPKYKQSGDGKWGMHMSKEGDTSMRSLLYIAANNVILHEPYFRSLYKHYMSKGKKSKVVKGIIMHKLLRILFGMLKNQTCFDMKVDQVNQQKKKDQSEKPSENASRRYQPLGVAAPISRSNYKKRRAVLECQISETDTITASSSTTQLQI